MFKSALNEFQEADALISKLLGEAPSSGPESPQKSISTIKDVYKIPVRIGKAGKHLDEGDQPWVVGTFLPKQYVNETHPTGHDGVDLKAPKGTPIYALGPGTVIDVSTNPKGGLTCKIAYEDGKLISYYAHMDSVKATVGQEVDSNTVVGTVGDSGNAKNRGSHCHLSTKLNGSYIDPFSVFGKRVGSYSKQAHDFNALIRKFAKI